MHAYLATDCRRRVAALEVCRGRRQTRDGDIMLQAIEKVTKHTDGHAYDTASIRNLENSEV